MEEGNLKSLKDRKRSPIWTYFEITDEEHAKCGYCGTIISFRTGTSSLRKHIKRKHSFLIEMKTDTEELGTENSEQLSVDVLEPGEVKFDFVGGLSYASAAILRKRSNMWNHFMLVDRTYAKCNYCCKISSYHSSITNLKKHLYRRHPKVLGKGNLPNYAKPNLKQPCLPKGRCQLHPRSSRRSVIWIHYTEAENFLAKCMYCEKRVSYKGSISNLKKHLLRKHDGVIQNANVTDSVIPNEKIANMIWTVFALVNDKQVQCSHCQEIVPYDESIIMPMVKHIQDSHSQLIEQDQLHATEVMSTEVLSTEVLTPVNMDVQICCLSDDIVITTDDDSLLSKTVEENMQSHHDVVEIIASGIMKENDCTVLLQTVEGQYTAVCDKVTERLDSVKHVSLNVTWWENEEIGTQLVIAAHFIDENFCLCGRALDVIADVVDVGTQGLAQLLKQVIVKWRLQEKITAVVTNGNNELASAVRSLGLLHIPCFAESLNHCLQGGIEKMEVITNKFHSVMSHCHFGDVDLVVDKKNWMSTLNLYKTALRKRTMIEKRVHRRVYVPTQYDWTILTKFIFCLCPFEQMINETKMLNKVTCSKVIPACKILIQKLSTLDTFDLNDSFRSAITAIISSLKLQFLNIDAHPFLATCTLLDPRFKEQGFSSTYYAAIAVRNIHTQLLNSDHKYVSSTSTNLWAEFELVQKSNNQASSVEQVQFHSFLIKPRISMNVNPLQWWKINQSNYPQLVNTIKSHFSLPLAPLPCQDIFSEITTIIKAKRDDLGSSNIQMILFIVANSYLSQL